MKKVKVLSSILLVGFTALAVSAAPPSMPGPGSVSTPPSTSMSTPTHLDTQKNPRGCSGCHKAHGKPLTPMMRDSSDKLCFICHGPYKVNATNIEEQASEVYSKFQKKSKHPILDTAKHHMPDEVLPETDPSKPRHVSCYDCHEAHTLRNDRKTGRMKGVSSSGMKKIAERDSEICYQCHSASRNKPKESQDISTQFQVQNASYHPVEKMAKGKSVSLNPVIAKGATMACSDCHEPHGSDYAPLLKKNYTLTDGPETSYAYDLCYDCHRRDSILSNESFKGSQSKQYGHREHVVFQRASCHACHSAHGSRGNKALIEFDRNIVTGSGQYIPASGGNGTCILVCHGKDHNLQNTTPLIQPLQMKQLRRNYGDRP